MRQFLACAFAWNISVRSMQACASVFASCSLLPPRILYYKPWIRVYARKNVLPDPRKSQKRVSDGKLYLSDPQKSQKRVSDGKLYLPDPQKSQKRVSDGKLYLPDPRKSQKRVSDNELHLSDPQNGRMVDITTI